MNDDDDNSAGEASNEDAPNANNYDAGSAAANQPDEMRVLRLTNELLELCRSTQTAYLRDSNHDDSSSGSDQGQESEVVLVGAG